MKTSKSRVLIVDDERFNIDLLVALLTPEYELIVAKSGNQAIKKASSDKPPDLILLDIMGLPLKPGQLMESTG